LALSAIETFVHTGEDGMHIEFASFRLEIPESIAIQRCRRPPNGWRSEPPDQASMRYGSSWLRPYGCARGAFGDGALGEQLSANPLHADFRKVRIGRPRPFAFDPRIRK
jgi:hypothetical protein